MKKEISNEKLEYINKTIGDFLKDPFLSLSEKTNIKTKAHIKKCYDFYNIVKSIYLEGLTIKDSMQLRNTSISRRTLIYWLNEFYSLNFIELRKAFIINKIKENPENYFRTNKRKININPKLRLEVFEKDNFKCVFCGSNESLQVDHIIPISKGGNDNIENLQTLCFLCNIGKSDNIINKKTDFV